MSDTHVRTHRTGFRGHGTSPGRKGPAAVQRHTREVEVNGMRENNQHTMLQSAQLSRDCTPASVLACSCTTIMISTYASTSVVLGMLWLHVMVHFRRCSMCMSPDDQDPINMCGSATLGWKIIWFHRASSGEFELMSASTCDSCGNGSSHAHNQVNVLHATPLQSTTV